MLCSVFYKNVLLFFFLKGYPGHPGSRGELGLPGCKGEPPEVIVSSIIIYPVYCFEFVLKSCILTSDTILLFSESELSPTSILWMLISDNEANTIKLIN